jgi:hypothetical protein
VRLGVVTTAMTQEVQAGTSILIFAGLNFAAWMSFTALGLAC